MLETDKPKEVKMFKYLYNTIMFYYAFLIRRNIRKMRRAGRIHGLPSLDQYTDEQIIRGIKIMKGKDES